MIDLAPFARRALELHTEWDAPHYLYCLESVTDGEAHPRSIYVIDTAIHPDNYAPLIGAVAIEQLKLGWMPVGFALQFEASMVVERQRDWSAHERARFDRDCRKRTFHLREDAREVACAWCVDTNDRVWSAIKRRDRPGHIEESAYLSGQAAPIGGQLIVALRAAAALVAAPQQEAHHASD